VSNQKTKIIRTISSWTTSKSLRPKFCLSFVLSCQILLARSRSLKTTKAGRLFHKRFKYRKLVRLNQTYHGRRKRRNSRQIIARYPPTRQRGGWLVDYQYGGSGSDSSYVETGSSYCSASPAANTAVPKSPVLIAVSMDEIVQTLNLPQCHATYQAVISRHVNVEVGFQFPAISCGIIGG
jgi:hypothetical protein